MAGFAVTNDGIPEYAEQLLATPLKRAGLALAFSQSTASSTEVLVGGSAFYPPMLEDIKHASSSVHINQFGFRPASSATPSPTRSSRKPPKVFRSGLSSTGKGRTPSAARGRITTGSLRLVSRSAWSARRGRAPLLDHSGAAAR